MTEEWKCSFCIERDQRIKQLEIELAEAKRELEVLKSLDKSVKDNSQWWRQMASMGETNKPDIDVDAMA